MKTRDPSAPATLARRDAPARLRFQARNPEAQSQFDFHLRQRPPDSRPPGPARADRSLSQHHSARRSIRWCCCFWNCRRARSMSTFIPRKPKFASGNRRVMHDFVRDTVRAALMKARPAPQFTTEIRAHATASSGLTPGAREWEPPSDMAVCVRCPSARRCMSPQPADSLCKRQSPPPVSARFQFEGGIAVEANAAIPVARGFENRFAEAIPETIPDNGCAPALDVQENAVRKTQPWPRSPRSGLWDRFAIRSFSQ